MGEVKKAWATGVIRKLGFGRGAGGLSAGGALKHARGSDAGRPGATLGNPGLSSSVQTEFHVMEEIVSSIRVCRIGKLMALLSYLGIKIPSLAPKTS